MLQVSLPFLFEVRRLRAEFRHSVHRDQTFNVGGELGSGSSYCSPGGTGSLLEHMHWSTLLGTGQCSGSGSGSGLQVMC